MVKILLEYEIHINGKWCMFFPGYTDIFDEFEDDLKFNIARDEKVYGRAIVDIANGWKPVYMYDTFNISDIRIKKYIKPIVIYT